MSTNTYFQSKVKNKDKLIMDSSLFLAPNMKNRSNFILNTVLCLALFCSFLLGGFLFSGIIISNIDSTTTQFGNWAMWVGSFAGGIAAIGATFAAFFTKKTLHMSGKTLKFLAKQHDEQLEMQVMQMCLTHKEAFYALLEQLENNYKNYFRFKNREALYQSLFPNNNFFTFSAKAPFEISDTEKHKTLNKIIKVYNERSNASPNQKQSIRFSIFSSSIKKLLQIEIIDKGQIGDLSIELPEHKEIHFNVFEIRLLYKIISDTTIQFFNFTGNSPPKEISYILNSLTSTLISQIIEKEKKGNYDPLSNRKFNMERDENNVITLLAKFLNLQCEGKLVNQQFNGRIHIELRNLFALDSTRFNNLLGSYSEQYRLLNAAYNWIHKIRLENSNKWDDTLTNRTQNWMSEVGIVLEKLRFESDN